MPSVIRAIPDPVIKGTGILQPGTPVPAAEIYSRASAAHDLVFGLAEVTEDGASPAASIPR